MKTSNYFYLYSNRHRHQSMAACLNIDV